MCVCEFFYRVKGSDTSPDSEKRGRQDGSRDDNGDVGGNDGDDGPRTPKKAKRGTKAGRRQTSNQRSATRRAGDAGD